jgi:hypothetical protein
LGLSITIIGAQSNYYHTPLNIHKSLEVKFMSMFSDSYNLVFVLSPNQGSIRYFY